MLAMCLLYVQGQLGERTGLIADFLSEKVNVLLLSTNRHPIAQYYVEYFLILNS